MADAKSDKLTTPTSRAMAINMAQDLYGLHIGGVFFGTMNDDFSPEISVEWSGDAMADFIGALSAGGGGEDAKAPTPKFASMKDAFQIGGVRTGKGFGLAAKKVFDKASYWNWSASVTLVDWDGTGLVWERWEALKNMALPKATTSSGALAGAMAGGITAFAGGGGVEGMAKGALKGLAGAVAVEAVGATGLIDEEAYQGALARSVVSAPDPVHIRIGRYGSTQGASPVASMQVVIESFGASFSKEMTVNGPVSATFNITFSSVEPVTAESMPIGGSRVRIIE